MLEIGIIATSYGEGNQAPIITSGDTFYVPQNSNVVGTVTAIDPNDDPITFSIVGGPDEESFTIDAELGELLFVPSSLPAPVGTINLLTGTYVINGTTYAIGALTKEPFDSVWYHEGGGPDESQIVPGRGWLITEANAVAPAADAALLALLTAPHTGMIEWEDFAFDGSDGPVWIYDEGGEARSGLEYVHRMWVSQQWVGIEVAVDDQVADQQVYADDTTYNWGGVNRIAWTLGTDDTNVSRNGDPEAPTSIDTTGIFNAPLPTYWIVFWGFTTSTGLDSVVTGIQPRTWRIQFDQNAYSRSTDRMKISFASHASSGLVVSACYIGERGTDAWDMVSPTQIFFNGGSAGFTIAADSIIDSDEFDFTFDGSKSYVISFHTTTTTLGYANRSGVSSYYKDNVNEAANADVTGYNFASGIDPAIIRLHQFVEPELVDVMVFSSWRSTMSWIMMGFARKIHIFAPQPKAMLPILSGIGDLPGRIMTAGFPDEIEQVADTLTTITVSWDTDAPGATSYQYWIDEGINGTPYEDNYTWTTLPGDKTITGLTAMTDYSIAVRGVNSAGYGPLAFTNASTTYPANLISLNGKYLTLNGNELTLN